MAMFKNLGSCDRQLLYMGVCLVWDVVDPIVGTSVRSVMLLYGYLQKLLGSSHS